MGDVTMPQNPVVPIVEGSQPRADHEKKARAGAGQNRAEGRGGVDGGVRGTVERKSGGGEGKGGGGGGSVIGDWKI